MHKGECHGCGKIVADRDEDLDEDNLCSDCTEEAVAECDTCGDKVLKSTLTEGTCPNCKANT